jgi:polar amino acid transport system substrate-binding protein
MLRLRSDVLNNWRDKMFGFLKFAGVTAFALCAGLLASGPVFADDSLAIVLKEKKIRIAVDVSSPPFGVLDKNQQPDGSDVAVARQLAADLGADLEFVQVPSNGRIPALLAGRADVTIASISITTERAKTVLFCNPNGALSIVIAGPKKVAISKPEDLVGKTIGLTRATLEEATVPKLAPPGTKIVWFDEIGATIQALSSGQVDAAGMTSFAAKAVADRNPAKQIENKLNVVTAYYGPIVRPGAYALRDWINVWIFVNTQNGRLAEIYKKHTQIDLPPLPTL